MTTIQDVLSAHSIDKANQQDAVHMVMELAEEEYVRTEEVEGHEITVYTGSPFAERISINVGYVVVDGTAYVGNQPDVHSFERML